LAALRNILVLLVIAQVSCLTAPRYGFAEERINPPASAKIPEEPGWKSPTYRGWEIVSINGLIATFYDLNQDGKLDYMVMRRIARKEDSGNMSLDSAIDTAKRDNLSAYISTPVIYFANKYPLFYCLGVDARRNCKDIWIDIQEDGLNGNEVLYTLSEPKIPVQ
jgi:hypothetical protein